MKIEIRFVRKSFSNLTLQNTDAFIMKTKISSNKVLELTQITNDQLNYLVKRGLVTCVRNGPGVQRQFSWYSVLQILNIKWLREVHRNAKDKITNLINYH